MNPKIKKMKVELQQNTDKINTLTERNVFLKAKITELENLEILGLVRERQISPADLEAAFGIKKKEEEKDTGGEGDK